VLVIMSHHLESAHAGYFPTSLDLLNAESHKQPGGWGFDAHEGIYRLRQFRAGSQPVTGGSGQ